MKNMIWSFIVILLGTDFLINRTQTTCKNPLVRDLVEFFFIVKFLITDGYLSISFKLNPSLDNHLLQR